MRINLYKIVENCILKNKYYSYNLVISGILIFSSLFIISCESDSPHPVTYKNIHQPCLQIVTSDAPILSETHTNPAFYELCKDDLSKFDKYQLDTNGIPLSKLGDEYVHYPITITQMATTYYKNYITTKDTIIGKRFMDLAVWLKNDFTDRGDYGFWNCHTGYAGYDLKSPWSSAMGQGFGLMVMYEAYTMTMDSSFLEIAEKALYGFDIPISNGGFMRESGDDVFYEEYPSDSTSQVLNGFIFSLCGLSDYYEATQSLKAKELFLKGVDYLEKNICKYSLFFTSRYSLYSLNTQLANAIGTGPGDGYHHIHVQQLSWLYIKTQRQIFYNYALDFLEKDLGDYESSYELGKKINSVKVDNCINCETHGANNLNDGVWSYGGYWSSKKPSEIVVDLGKERKDIRQLSFFFTNEESANISVEIHKMSTEGGWVFVDSVSYLDDSTTRYQDVFQTGHYKTFINSYALKPFQAQQIKLKIKNRGNKIFGIRELDFQFDRKADLDKIIKKFY